MTETNIAASSSAAGVYDDIVRLIAPSDRPGFHMMFQNAVRGRELPNDELRRIAERVWREFNKYGWPRN